MVGLLANKTAQVIINTDTPSAIYEKSGMHTALININTNGIFGFCGISTQVTFFGQVNSGTDEQRKEYLNQLTQIFSNQLPNKAQK